MEDDGLYLPTIRAHSLEKLRRHNYYAGMFAAAMAGKYGHLPYIGLYSGAGRARLQPTTFEQRYRLPDGGTALLRGVRISTEAMPTPR